MCRGRPYAMDNGGLEEYGAVDRLAVELESHSYRGPGRQDERGRTGEVKCRDGTMTGAREGLIKNEKKYRRTERAGSRIEQDNKSKTEQEERTKENCEGESAEAGHAS